MEIKWTDTALADLDRLYHFLAQKNKSAAGKTIQTISKAPSQLALMPRIGERLTQFDNREVRRMFVNQYEIRYEINEKTIFIVQIWHTRENR